MIAFCIFCRDVAKARDGDIIEAKDVYDAEDVYSDHIYRELEDEIKIAVPETTEMMRALRDVGFTRFDQGQWLAAVKSRDARRSENTAKDWMRTLFDFAVLGISRIGGKQRGSKLEFIYSNRLLNPTFEGDVFVHPALKKQLNLVEPREDNKKRQTGTTSRNDVSFKD